MKFKRLKLKIFISFAADYKNAQVAELVDALDSKSSLIVRGVRVFIVQVSTYFSTYLFIFSLNYWFLINCVS